MVDSIDYKKIYLDSFWRTTNTAIGGRGFFDKFYENFLASSPEAREKFRNTNMFFQRRMLHDSLIHMQRFSIYKRAEPFIQNLAKKHSKSQLDIKPHLYDVWLTSLIDTVKEYDSEFDDEVELAWRMHFAPGITYMKHKYDK